MKKSHKVLFFINSFSMGIIVPVLSLVLLTHGATLKTLSLFVGIICIIVVATEFPSGILSDMYGRKIIFLFSHLFILLSFVCIIISKNFVLLAIACVFQGFGKAFSSGTIEVMEIESYIQEKGTVGLARINSTLAIIDGTGLAIGSFCGGFLGTIGSRYTILLLVCIVLEIAILLSALFIVKEKRKAEKSSLLDTRQQLSNQFENIFVALHDTRFLKIILSESFLLGLGLSVVEVYWQPTLEIFLPQNLNWIFGIINCMGYISVIIGNKVAELYWKRKNLTENLDKSVKHYWILRIILPLLIVTLGLCKNIGIFFTAFIVIYCIIGAGNLYENTLFHNLISNVNRSSMMSLSSLFLRGGGIITSALGSLILSYTTLSFVWMILTLIMFISTTIVWYISIKLQSVNRLKGLS